MTDTITTFQIFEEPRKVETHPYGGYEWRIGEEPVQLTDNPVGTWYWARDGYWPVGPFATEAKARADGEKDVRRRKELIKELAKDKARKAAKIRRWKARVKRQAEHPGSHVTIGDTEYSFTPYNYFATEAEAREFMELYLALKRGPAQCRYCGKTDENVGIVVVGSSHGEKRGYAHTSCFEEDLGHPCVPDGPSCWTWPVSE